MKNEMQKFSLLRTLRSLRKEKWFRFLSTAVLDCLFVLLLGYFLLYRCTNWYNGDRVFFIPADTIYLLTDIFLWAAIALEFVWSPLRGLAAAALMLLRGRPDISYPQLLVCESLLLTLVCNLGSRRNNRNTWLAIHAAGIEILFFLRLKGLVVPSYDIGMGEVFSYPGTSLALGNVNSLAILGMTLLMMLWLPRKWKPSTTFVVFLLGAELMMFVTQCRTLVVLMLVLPLFAWLMERQKEDSKGNVVFWGITPVIGVLVTFLLSLYAVQHKIPTIAQEVNAFWQRFTDYQVIRDYSFTLFGSVGTGPFTGINFDNFYWWLLHYCGLIPTILLLAAYGLMNIRLYKRKEFRLLTLSVMFLIYGLMENALIYPFHFFVPLLAFARPEETESTGKDEIK